MRNIGHYLDRCGISNPSDKSTITDFELWEWLDYVIKIWISFFMQKKSRGRSKCKRDLRTNLSRPTFVEMEAINDFKQFDQILPQATQTSSFTYY